jgi:hypothetical protein
MINKKINNNKKLRQSEKIKNMDSSKKKILLVLAVVFSIAIISFLVYYFYFSKATEQARVDKENIVIAALIQEEIGGFNIKKAYDYQGGVIMNVYRQNGDLREDYEFFYKDGSLQRLPEEYVKDAIKNKLSEEEKQNKTVYLKFREEYNSGMKDEKGNDIFYYNRFVMANELPESAEKEDPMFPGYLNKYQIIIANGFGQVQTKFLSSQLPQ